MEKEFDWCKDYGLKCVEVTFSKTESLSNVNIKNSCKIKKTKHMKEVLNWLREYQEYKEMKLKPQWVQICEWKTHNLLYGMGIAPARTHDVDLNDNNPWYLTVAYICVSLFYF